MLLNRRLVLRSTMIEISYAAIIAVVFFVVYMLRRKRHITLQNVHCMVTGGSSGIGLAVAIQVARWGGNVSIVARSKDRLASAKSLIDANVKNSNQKVLTFSADITHHGEGLDGLVKEAEKEAGPINFLVNSAGTSVCYSFLETPVEDFKKMVDLNYLGSVYMTRAVLPSMQEHKCGTIVFVSSIAGLMGLYGYTAYSSSKFALLGLAESLQMEVKPYNINVSVAFPPDTDTPGYAEEIKNKPIETVRISESAGLFSAEQVATAILEDALDKKFMCTVGFDGYVLSTLCSGMTPINSFFNLVMQVMTMGIFRMASVYLWFQFDRIIKKCAAEKQNLQKEEAKCKVS